MLNTRSWAIAGLIAVASVSQAAPVSGKIVDAKGHAIAGAILYCQAVFRSANPKLTKILALQTQTDAQGAFVFKDAPIVPTSQNPIVCIVKLRSGFFASAVIVGDRETVTVEQDANNTALKVKNAQGQPVPNAKASVSNLVTSFERGNQIPFGWLFSGGIYNDKASATFSGQKDGTISLKNLSKRLQGQFEISAPGYAKTTSYPMFNDPNSDSLNITLFKGGILKGVVMADGKPVSGVTVGAQVIIQHTGYEKNGTTGSDGSFTITDIPAGTVKLSVQPVKQLPQYVKKKSPDFLLKDGAELDGLLIQLEKGITLKGSVKTKEKGLPVEGAHVFLSADGGATDYKTTGKDGLFEFTVPEGHVYVAVDTLKERRLPKQVYAHIDLDKDHVPTPDLLIADEFTYPIIKSLHGQVVDGMGKPVANAVVLDLDTKQSATADAEGNYKFPSNMNPGDTLVATLGDAMSTKGVVLADKDAVDLKLDGKTSSITGVVTDDDGKPLADASISLGAESKSKYLNFPSTTTDAKGQYEFKGLFADVNNFFLWAKLRGYGQETIQPIRIAQGEQKKLNDLKLHSADGVIEGNVVDEKGKPVADVAVSAQTDSAPDVLTDKDGRFRLQGVPRGQHYLVLRGGTYSVGGETAKTGDKNVKIVYKPRDNRVAAGVVSMDQSGHVAPEIQVQKWLNAAGYKPADLKGKIVVIDFWGVYCRPCIESLPDVETLSKKYKDKGVIVFGILTPDAEAKKALEIMKSKGVTYPVAIDGKEQNGIGVTSMAFGPSGIPHMFLIDANGKIQVDTHDVDDIEAGLRKLLEK